MSPEEREWVMEKLGLNEPISVQYVKWVKNAFHGEFGISFKYKQDVVEVIGGRIGNTLVLGGTYVVESVFSYPGIGALSYESARYHDYNLLMLLCMMSGILVIFCNIVSQTINEQIDPRMKDEVITEKSEVVEG